VAARRSRAVPISKDGAGANRSRPVASGEPTSLRERVEEIFRNEQTLQLVLDTIPQRVFWKDLNSAYVGCNATLARDAGFKDPADLIGLTDYDMVWRLRADRYRADDRQVMETGVAKINYEEPQVRPDGSEGWVRTSKLPLREADGRIIGVLCTYEDITDRKRAEEDLRQSEKRYRHIIESITDYAFSVLVVDGKTTSTAHGSGSVAVTGFTPEELSRDPLLWLETVFPADRPLVVEQTRRVIEGQGVAPLEHRIVRKDGAIRWVRNTLVQRLDSSGSVVAYDALIQDVTERRALQGQLLEAQKVEGIGRLAGGIAHDFNNLLTAILGYLEMARNDLPADLAPDHPVRTDLAEIGAAGQRAASLTHQLLTFASKQLVTPVRLDLSELVADLLKMLRPLLGESIAVETALEPGLAMVEADPIQIQQLLVSLAVNARDAMPDGGLFVIETATEEVTEATASECPGLNAGRHVRLSVTDTGWGMSEEVRSHLFEPFYTTKERGNGAGLGLATCHGIVRQMRGHILVFSEPGCGTTFRILLPCVDGPAEVRSAAPEMTPAPAGTETILVVEDESVVRRLAVLALRARGYTVLEASDGVGALQIARRVAPGIDLVVSDVVMLGLSGPDLLRRLRAVVPAAKGLLVSGHAESAVLPGGPSDFGSEFLAKPFTPERLARKVREILDAPPTEGA